MNDPTSPHDSLEAYVLGALDRDERIQFEEHLLACASCRSERDGYTGTLASLDRIYVHAPPPQPRVSGRTRERTAFRSPAWLATAAAAVLAIGIAAPRVVRYERSENAYAAIAIMLAHDPHLVTLTSRDPGTSGRAIVGDGHRRSGFIAAGLPAAPEGMVYRVWVRTAAGRRSPGELEPTSDGLQVLVTPGDALAHASSVHVMLEREHDPALAPRHEVLGGDVG